MNAFADVHYLSQARYDQVDTRFDRDLGIYWAWMNPKPRPFFNPQLLAELTHYVDTIENGAGTMSDARGERGELRYTVIASKADGVFNLGGDLALFKSAILRRDRATLVHYGRSCVDTLYRWWRNCELPITTISLVQGDALGGGFECALSSSVLIASPGTVTPPTRSAPTPSRCWRTLMAFRSMWRRLYRPSTSNARLARTFRSKNDRRMKCDRCVVWPKTA